MRRHNLLVVDYDYFFPEPEWDDPQGMLYDWGHKEAPFFIEGIWGGRAEGFLMNNLPLPDLTGEELTFWDRFTITPDAKLWYADSNSCAVNPSITGKRQPFDTVWLYDAHHDSGYDGLESASLRRQRINVILSEGRFYCDNWTTLYAAACGSLIYVRYPAWKPWAMEAEPQPLFDIDRKVDDGTSPDVVFDRVFVCRSGAWVPPWHNIDARFEQFVERAPVKKKVDLTPGGLTRRSFDLEHVKINARRSAMLLEAYKISRQTGEDEATVIGRLKAQMESA